MFRTGELTAAVPDASEQIYVPGAEEGLMSCLC